jgi:hypothetical protein
MPTGIMPASTCWKRLPAFLTSVSPRFCLLLSEVIIVCLYRQLASHFVFYYKGERGRSLCSWIASHDSLLLFVSVSTCGAIRYQMQRCFMIVWAGSSLSAGQHGESSEPSIEEMVIEGKGHTICSAMLTLKTDLSFMQLTSLSCTCTRVSAGGGEQIILK